MFVQDKADGEQTAIQHPSVAGLLAFCESQKPDTAYEWLDCHECACGQYARSIGQFEDWFGGDGAPVYGWNRRWSDLNVLASGALGETTFGALAGRLRHVMALREAYRK